MNPVNHKDAVIERYEAFEDDPNEEGQGSQGGTIMAARYLNAAIGHIALGILRRKSELDTPFSNMFHENWKRNFIQLRLHPEYSNSPESMFFNAMKSNKGACFFDSIWREVKPILNN